MRVVITGGSGLIGRRLVAALAGRGDQVVVTSRRPQGVTGLASELAAWDGLSAEELTPIINGADAVVHLIGEGIADRRWTAARKRQILDSRTRSTAAVVAAFTAASNRPATLLQGSAVGFYGSRGDEELTEDSALGSGFLADVTRQWEAASAEVEPLGVRRVLLRTGVVLAAEGGALAKMALPFRFFAGGPVGSGRQWVPWIHIADQVAAMLFLLDSPQIAGAFNLVAPEPATSRDLARAIGKALRRPALMPAPALAMKLVLGEMAELLLMSQRVEPAALAAAGYSFQFPGIEAATRDLLA